ncbi:MAG: histidine kinase, partial [Candidatus Cloacimonetes bacterium]|nr:histidine kinase [Candidatus Cloacimonadota bacterium]
MKKIFLKVLLLLFLLPLFSQLDSIVQGDVLIVQSYHSGYKWTDEVQSGLITTLRNNNPKLRIFTEYLDSKRFSSPEELKFTADTFIRRYNSSRFDVIVAVDNYALTFLLKIRPLLFPETPLVFCGINGFQESSLGGQKGITGVNEKAGIRRNLQLIQKLHPNITNLLIINDDTITGQELNREIESALNIIPPRIKVRYEHTISMENLKEVISGLPEQSVILYTLFFKDSNGVFYEFDQSIINIVEAAKCPVYGCWDFSLDYGIVGGYLASGIYQGNKAAEKVLQILNGADVNTLGYDMDSANQFIFDYNVLKKWGIKSGKLPS